MSFRVSRFRSFMGAASMMLFLPSAASAEESHMDSFENMSSEDYFCPEGFSYNDDSGLCESETEALGPFPAKMRALCKQYGGGPACDGNTWAVNFARSIRGVGDCPQGTQKISGTELCAADGEAYGPFTVAHVESCEEKGGGSACKSLRWSESFAVYSLPKDEGIPIPDEPDDGQPRTEVPYYYQHHNSYRPTGSCNITTTAMAISFLLNRRVTPDHIYLDSHRVRGRTGLVYDSGSQALIARQYGLKGSKALWSTSASVIKSHLDKGHPVSLQGYFTNWSFGHIILLVGYDDVRGGWIVHDPNGKWTQRTGSGSYRGANSYNGKGVFYPYSAVSSNSLAGRGKYHVAVYAP